MPTPRKTTAPHSPAGPWPGRALVVGFGGEIAAFTLQKLSRKDLYVTRRRVALDDAGQPCQRAALTRDGMLLRSGMTGQGYCNADGTWVPQKALTGLGPSGESLPLVPGTLGTEQALEPATAQQLLDLHVTAVYRLTSVHAAPKLESALEAGRIFRYPFNYRADFRAETAFLVANAEGAFAVVGVPAAPAWLGPDAAPPPESPALDDLDFDMFSEGA
ncbi:MAG: hypothetical protein RL653_1013 [Pseudomonadota bacterium]